MAAKVKKKCKVDPLVQDVELEDLGHPALSSDLSELFESDLETPDLGKLSSYDSQVLCEQLESPSRSSTPSGKGIVRRLKRNAIKPINEEEVPVNSTPSSGIEAWGDLIADDVNAVESPEFEKLREVSDRPASALSGSSKKRFSMNKVAPIFDGEQSRLPVRPESFQGSPSRPYSECGCEQGSFLASDAGRKLSLDDADGNVSSMLKTQHSAPAHERMLALGECSPTTLHALAKPAWEVTPSIHNASLESGRLEIHRVKTPPASGESWSLLDEKQTPGNSDKVLLSWLLANGY